MLKIIFNYHVRSAFPILLTHVFCLALPPDMFFLWELLECSVDQR